MFLSNRQHIVRQLRYCVGKISTIRLRGSYSLINKLLPSRKAKEFMRISKSISLANIGLRF